jgi:hypothetical protein
VATGEAATERQAASTHVGEGTSDFGFAGEFARGILPTHSERHDNRLESTVAFSSTMFRQEAFDRLLDTMKLVDAVERFRSNRRAGGGELARDMRPTARFGYPIAGGGLIEVGPLVGPASGLRTGTDVGVDDAGERLQIGPRVLVFAIGQVSEQRRPLPHTGERPLVADIDLV